MADEFRRALAKRDTLVATYTAEVAALKETHGNDMAAMKLELEHLSPWAELPKASAPELLWLVLEKLQDAPLAGDWGGFEGSKHVRLVNSGWRNSHDALVTRLAVSKETTDAGMWLLVRRFPAVVSLEVKGADYYHRAVLTDVGMRAVSKLTGLTALSLSYCSRVTDEGVRTVSMLTGLTSLNLTSSFYLADEGMRAVSMLTGLTSLDLSWCTLVTDEALLAVSSLIALTTLNLAGCKLTSEGLKTLSTLTALSTLNLSSCKEVTDEGLQALGSLTSLSFIYFYGTNVSAAAKQALGTALPNLRIKG